MNMLERSGTEAWCDEWGVGFPAAVTDLAEVAGQTERRGDRGGAVGPFLPTVGVDVNAQKLVGVVDDDDVILRRRRRHLTAENR
jgi:hypothetical protein